MGLACWPSDLTGPANFALAPFFFGTASMALADIAKTVGADTERQRDGDGLRSDRRDAPGIQDRDGVPTAAPTLTLPSVDEPGERRSASDVDERDVRPGDES